MIVPVKKERLSLLLNPLIWLGTTLAMTIATLIVLPLWAAWLVWRRLSEGASASPAKRESAP